MKRLMLVVLAMSLGACGGTQGMQAQAVDAGGPCDAVMAAAQQLAANCDPGNRRPPLYSCAVDTVTTRPADVATCIAWMDQEATMCDTNTLDPSCVGLFVVPPAAACQQVNDALTAHAERCAGQPTPVLTDCAAVTRTLPGADPAASVTWATDVPCDGPQWSVLCTDLFAVPPPS